MRQRADRAALRRAKSSPAWCDDRVSGDGRHHQEALGAGDRFQRGELVGRHEAHHGMMLARRLQILADGQEIDIGGAQVVHQLEHLVALLAEPHHDPGLGEHARVDLLDLLQQADRRKIARARPDCEVLRRHGLEVMIEHVGLGGDDRRQHARFAQEIRRQDLDRGRRAERADRTDCLREVLGAAVGEIVAVDRSHHHMMQSELRGRLGDAKRLAWIERARQPGLDVAEGARPRAGVAHDHEGRVLLFPALADIGAASFFADGVEPIAPDDGVGIEIAARHRRLDADPVGLLQHRRVRTVRLFGMARATGGVVDDGHAGSGTGGPLF